MDRRRPPIVGLTTGGGTAWETFARQGWDALLLGEFGFDGRRVTAGIVTSADRKRCRFPPG